MPDETDATAALAFLAGEARGRRMGMISDLRVCVKCYRGCHSLVAWCDGRAANHEAAHGLVGEHMIHTCNRCGFALYGPCHDAAQPETA